MFDRFLFEILQLKNIVQPDRPQMTIRQKALHDGYQKLQTHTESM